MRRNELWSPAGTTKAQNRRHKKAPQTKLTILIRPAAPNPNRFSVLCLCVLLSVPLCGYYGRLVFHTDNSPEDL